MDIILLKNIEKVGRKFEIVKVKNGFGRNYLIPQGLAIIANKTNRSNLDSYKRQEASKLEQMIDVFRDIATKVNGKTLDIPVKCGTSGKIFGSVTTLQISKAMKEQLDAEVDRRDILLPDDAKMVDTYTAVLDLHPDVDAKVEFTLRPDDPKVAAIIQENREKEAAEAVEAERRAAEAAATYAAEKKAAKKGEDEAEEATTEEGAKPAEPVEATAEAVTEEATSETTEG